jgi:hypothetical protein
MMTALALAALLGTSGCIVHAHRPPPPPHRDVVVIERGHVHSDHCGHYYHRGGWYHSQGHVHGASCGHVFRGGLWIVVD